MCNTKKTRSAKYRTPYLYNTFVFCRFSFFNNIRDNRPFCRRRWWFPVNCVRTISQSKGQNIKVLYKSASQSPWMQNIYMTEQFLSAFFFFFQWRRHDGFQLKQKAMGHSEATSGALWAATVPEAEPKTVFIPNGAASHRKEKSKNKKYAAINKT